MNDKLAWLIRVIWMTFLLSGVAATIILAIYHFGRWIGIWA